MAEQLTSEQQQILRDRLVADVLVQTTNVVGEAIKELGEVPSGLLYARLMVYMDINTYNTIIGLLEKAGKITNKGHLLTWVGGA